MMTQSDPGDRLPPAGWVAGPQLHPPVPTLARLLDRSLATTPSAEALVVRQQDGSSLRWTYEELDAEVTRRAAGLCAAGVRPGDSVLLVAARTPGLVPALLALLRLGAAYVPVDPAAPDARWHALTEAVGAAALIGPAEAVARAAVALPPGTLLLDLDAPLPEVPVG